MSFKPTFPNISNKNQSTDVVCISSDEEDNSKPAAKPQVSFFRKKNIFFFEILHKDNLIDRLMMMTMISFVLVMLLNRKKLRKIWKIPEVMLKMSSIPKPKMVEF